MGVRLTFGLVCSNPVLATDGAPIDTDENQIKSNGFYRCSSVPHLWQQSFQQSRLA
jgi:hypothetical protein